jgi:hypothetical protein
MFLQGLLDYLTTAGIIGLAAAAIGLLVQPYLLPAPPPSLCWAAFGGILGAAAVCALALAIVRRPSPVAVALAIDHCFGLEERVTTALTLGPQQITSPAGVALLADVDYRVAPLRIGQRFPLRLRRRALWLPCLGLVLGLLAAFWRPTFAEDNHSGDQQLAATPEVQVEIEKKLKGLEKKGPAKAKDAKKSAELERLEAELERLSKRPHDTREQARQAVKEIGKAEDQVKERDKQLQERAAALREQMRQLERLTGQRPKDGPAQKLDKALDNADFRKAREEAEKLGRQLAANEQADRLRKKLDGPNKMSEEEKKEAREQLQKFKDHGMKAADRDKLANQMKDMQDRLQRLTRSEAARKQLRELMRRGLINQEQLDRELDQLDRNDAKISEELKKALEDIAQKLAEAQQCLQEGKDGEAAQKLREAAEMLGKLDTNGEARALAQQLQALEGARRALCKALDGPPGPGGPARGRRPESKDGDTGHVEDRARSDFDKGQLDVIDQVPGDGFKGPRTPAEISDDIHRAAQEAPEAIDRQRLPRSASDMAKGYFDKLRDRK